jgi:FKBP-type peptidyl-prolyl cis-trans isomerase FkpA
VKLGFAFRIAVACALLAGTAACGDSPSTPSSASPTFTQTDLRVGTGTDATAGTALTVNYTGWLYDATKTDHKGVQFDSSVGLTPFTFTLGVGQVIAGWDQGLVGMKTGGVRQLVVPSSLAYGGVRNTSIPPFATLIFEIELLGVKAATP